MQLFLMRHADAQDGNGNDFSRTLTDKGRKQAERMGEWLANLIVPPLMVVASPYPRAHETANIMAARIGRDAPAQPDERLAPGMAVDVANGVIHEYGVRDGDLMLVGHSPDLDRLAAHLLGGREGTVEMRKGAVAHFSVARAGFGGSVLHWLINPRM